MTLGIIHRAAIVTSATLASLAGTLIISPGVSTATECGPGTFYDAPSDTCVVAAQPPPPPPPPPPPQYRHGGDWTPGVSVCLSGRRGFVSVCF